jgi:Sel1 repeat
MGFLSRFFLKRAERSFEKCLRLTQVALCDELRDIYSSQMDREAASTLAAQVVNFLKGVDIDEIARVKDEPLRSRIIAILPQVRQRAAECMQADRQTREIIVATLRMTNVLNFGKYGTAWLQNPAKMRIQQLLVEYGPDFPEEINPGAYELLTAKYLAAKRPTWWRGEADDNMAALRKAAEQGNADAEHMLGNWYLGGRGVPPDYTQVAFWHRRAAERGHDGAQRDLGVLYRTGHGVSQDYVQAAAWCRKAAEQDNAQAQLDLGTLYGDGQGVSKDYAEAYFWLDRAAAGKLQPPLMELAAKRRDEAASHLTPADLSREQERARKWLEAHPAKPQ